MDLWNAVMVHDVHIDPCKNPNFLEICNSWLSSLFEHYFKRCEHFFAISKDSKLNKTLNPRYYFLAE